MTVDKETEAEIRRLYFGEHWKKGTIVAQLALLRQGGAETSVWALLREHGDGLYGPTRRRPSGI